MRITTCHLNNEIKCGTRCSIIQLVDGVKSVSVLHSNETCFSIWRILRFINITFNTHWSFWSHNPSSMSRVGMINTWTRTELLQAFHLETVGMITWDKVYQGSLANRKQIVFLPPSLSPRRYPMHTDARLSCSLRSMLGQVYKRRQKVLFACFSSGFENPNMTNGLVPSCEYTYHKTDNKIRLSMCKHIQQLLHAGSSRPRNQALEKVVNDSVGAIGMCWWII